MPKGVSDACCKSAGFRVDVQLLQSDDKLSQLQVRTPEYVLSLFSTGADRIWDSNAQLLCRVYPCLIYSAATANITMSTSVRLCTGTGRT